MILGDNRVQNVQITVKKENAPFANSAQNNLRSPEILILRNLKIDRPEEVQKQQIDYEEMRGEEKV